MTDPTAANAIVLHIGVHKTGSTALQAALQASRSELAGHGILYPGRGAAHHDAAQALTGRTFGFSESGSKPAPRSWPRLVKAANKHKGRVIISSEFFGRMRKPAVQRAAAAFQPGRLHVFLAVRPLADLLPSSWQQYLKSGMTQSYEDWLHEVLDGQKPDPHPNFRAGSDFAWLLRRWLSVVPADRITAVILDPGHRELLFDTTDELLGLPVGFLAGRRVGGPSNRSLTAPEAELVRQTNLLLRESMAWPDYYERIRRGAARTIVETRKVPGDEPRLTTPEWALEVAMRRQHRDYHALTGSGIELVGDPRRLLEPRTGAPAQAVTQIPAELAGLAVAAAAGYRPPGLS